MKNVRVVSDLSGLLPVSTCIEKVISTAAAALVTTVPAGAQYARIQARGADLTYTMDNSTDPVAGGPGFILANGNEIIVRTEVALKLKGIRNASTDVDVQIQWMG